MKDHKEKKLRIGLDLDGVILYNPLRIARPLIVLFKSKMLHKKQLKFTFPHSKLTQTIFYLFHKSSIFIAPGFKEIRQMARQGEAEVYIITGRYSFLKKDYVKWLRRTKALECFSGCFYNEQDEQPHLFKERLIKKLDLDYFVEDNWDIVNYLNNTFKHDHIRTKVLWIYNIFDRKIDYQYKFPVLQKVATFLKSK